MNTVHTALLALALASTGMHAAAAQTEFKVVIDCTSNRAPKMADVAEVVGTYNFWQTYAARERLISLAKSRCKRGADFVQFVPGTEPSSPEQDLASVASREP